MLKTAHRLARYLPRPLRRRLISVVPARFRPARPVRSAPKPTATVSLVGLATGRHKPSAKLPPARVVSKVRSALDRGDFPLARSAGEALLRRPATVALGSLVCALVAFDRGQRASAWTHLRDVPVELWSAFAVREHALTGLGVDPVEVHRQLTALVEAPSAQVGAQGWFDACAAVFGAGDTDLARRLYARFDHALDADPSLDVRLAEHRDWLRPWVAATPDSPSAPAAAPGRVTFAVMDYGHPGRARASANIGDHVQSIASLGHLVRRRSLSFAGDPELVGLLDKLAARVPAELQVDGPPAVVDVLTVHRDASMYQAIPPGTWTLGFGWFMHPIYEVRYGFPFHDNLRPVFVSFHCSKRELLTPEAVAYLVRYGPVASRAWTTVDILLSMGVPAFFSGCLTTTTSTVFPVLTNPPPLGARTAYVDLPDQLVPEGAATFRHSSDAIRFRSFVRNVDDAVALLETYRRGFSRVATSRLHAYLPSRSLGLEVDFWPKNRSDPRFEGLIDITDDQFDTMRRGLLDKLDAILGAILSAGSEEDVYALWREITADDVAAARERHHAPASVAPLAVEPALLVDRMRAGTVAVRRQPSSGEGDAISVVIPLDGEAETLLRRTVAVAVSSAVGSTSRPLEVTVLSRTDVGQVDVKFWAALLPEVGLQVVSTAGLRDVLHGPDGRAVAESDLALVLLPELLTDRDRIVLLPAAAVVRGDLAQLADLDLRAQTLAAPTTRGHLGSSGFGLLHAAAGRLRDHTALAAELRRAAHARHTFDFDSFTTAVLVIDLAAMRRTDFVAELVPYLPAFGLRLREFLCLYAGPDRAAVPAAWDAVPTRDVVVDPHLLHWPDALKPWQRRAVPGDRYWRAARPLAPGTVKPSWTE